MANGYDSCSSADVNPIGGISKTDLKRFIAYAQTSFDLPILERLAFSRLNARMRTDQSSFLDAVPSAELIPIGETVQSDEVGVDPTQLTTRSKWG
jgi:NAD+ synthase (glutamine-hydrolysing)